MPFFIDHFFSITFYSKIIHYVVWLFFFKKKNIEFCASLKCHNLNFCPFSEEFQHLKLILLHYEIQSILTPCKYSTFKKKKRLDAVMLQNLWRKGVLKSFTMRYHITGSSDNHQNELLTFSFIMLLQNFLQLTLD